MSQTPRTDAEAGYWNEKGLWIFDSENEGSYVPAFFARELELETIALKAELNETQGERDKYRFQAQDSDRQHDIVVDEVERVWKMNDELKAERDQLLKKLAKLKACSIGFVDSYPSSPNKEIQL